MLQDFFFYVHVALFYFVIKKLKKKSKFDFCFFSAQVKGSLHSSTKLEGLSVCCREYRLLRYYIVEG